MAAALRRGLTPATIARAALAALFALPLAAALGFALAAAFDAGVWRGLAADAQLPRAAALTLFSAIAGTLGALALTLLIATGLHGRPAWARLQRWLAPMLALPHAAFAIGLAWLVAPTGALARLLAPAVGWTEPPAWQTVNDRHALLLSAVLVLKELPFLLWSLMALLARPELAAGLQRQLAAARTLGYPPAAVWWRVLWPAWLAQLAWPLLAVLAYGLAVVDLALIVGPNSPPTLAALAYADLVDADPQRNARGAALALALAGLLLVCVVGALGFWALIGRIWRQCGSDGRRPGTGRGAGTAAWPARGASLGLAGLYAIVGTLLLLLSVAGVWAFPAAWPQVLTLDAWRRVAEQAGTVGLTLGLGFAAAGAALLLCVAWFEAAPPAWDRWATPAVLAPLVLPPLLLMSGLYRAALVLRLDGTLAGLAWAHLMVVLPYAFITLRPAWRAFDRRYEQLALTLGRGRPAFWWRAKWPMLAGPLAGTLAVGFAVSAAQFLATQFLGAGRHATVTTEAVLLASGGQRTVAAAFAALQALLPLLAFGLAAAVARRATMRA